MATTRNGTEQADGVRSPRGDKRRALLDGALSVFAQDGYTRASINTIASAAAVSTRTIYNQYGDKATLFEAVIVDSAKQVADAQIATVQRHLGKIVNIEDDLIEFARAWAKPDPQYANHFALVRQIHADANHIPEATLRAWQDAGPLRVRKEIADHLARIANAGHLSVGDPDLAAVHLVELIAGDITNRSFYGAIPLSPAETGRRAAAGVRAVLHRYGTQDHTEH